MASQRLGFGTMNFVKNNRAASAVIVLAGLGVLAWLAFGFFGIQAAFVDTVVDEDGPVFAAAPASVSAELASGEPVAAAPVASAVPEPTAVFAATSDSVSGLSEPEAETSADAEAAPATTDSAVQAEPTPAPTATEAPTTESAVQAEPTPAPAPTAEPVEQTPGEIVTTFSGSFQSLNGYSVGGSAQVLSNGTDQRFLRLENFASDNGPDLKVYLRAANGEFVSLGALTGNIGNQNYEVPPGVDLSVFNSVEIWCERFSTGFGAASLFAT